MRKIVASQPSGSEHQHASAPVLSAKITRMRAVGSEPSSGQASQSWTGGRTRTVDSAVFRPRALDLDYKCLNARTDKIKRG
jgi:hypothetical protein